MVRLIGYVRVSRVAGREGERFISVPVQREKIEKFAAAGGHTVVEWRDDLDQPGSKLSRPGFQAALEAVEAGSAEGVIVAKLDRFARSIADAANAIQRLTRAGGQLVSVEDGFDSSTPMGRFASTMVLAFAELELERIRENWAVANTRAIARGVHICKVAPAGYRKREDGRLEPDPVAAPVIRDVFRRRADGASWAELCAFLDEQLPRTDSGAWTRQTVTSMIARRTYLGEARQGEIVNLDAHPPLVTRGDWEAAQASPREGSRARDGGALLAGLLRCAGCGQTMGRVSDGSRGYRKYRCRKRHGDGVCPDPVSVSVGRADDYVERELLAWIEREPVIAEGKPSDGTLEQAVAALEAAEAELRAYMEANLVSVVGKEAFLVGATERQRAIETARQAVDVANAVTPLESVRSLYHHWADLDVRERRHLLGSVIDSIVVLSAPSAGKGTPAADRLAIAWR